MKKIREAVDAELTREQRQRLLDLDNDLKDELIDSQNYLQKELEILNEVKKKK